MAFRVSGLASGMDIDSIVKEMMNAKRIPLNKLNQQKTILQWQRDSYRDLNSKLVDFRNNKLLKYNTPSQINTQKVVVSGNTTALTAEATSSANGIPMTFSVTQLAKVATASTQGMSMIDGGGKRLTSNSKLSDLSDLMVQNGGTPPEIINGEYILKINKIDIKFGENFSIADVVSKINMTDGANVTAKFDELNGKLMISSKTFSTAGTVTLGADNSLLELFGSGGATTSTEYEPAEVYINGTAPENKLTFSSNNFAINGVQIKLLSTTTDPATPTLASSGSPTTINTQSDPTKALETIKNFVQDYNDLLNILNSKVTEEKYRDFPPLSDEQKKEMTDKDIEQWEAKAKSGMLNNDKILKSTMTAMRAIISEQMGDLSLIGITTGKYFENGKLYLDEAKLKTALENNPKKVELVLQGSTLTDGVFDSLSAGINTTLNQISTKAGTSKYSTDINSTYKSESIIGKKLTDYNSRISALQSRLVIMESSFYKQFTAMEKAINRYNSQSTSLSSYFS